MLPGMYEFHWSAGHLIFLGAFFLVLSCIGVVVGLSIYRALQDVRSRRVARIRWQEEFHDLPPACRSCRYALRGEAPGRVCENGFDCRACAFRARQLAAAGDASAATVGEPAAAATPSAASSAAPGEEDLYGFTLPAERYYHRGHTWVAPEADGTLTIGLDDLGERLIAAPDGLALPLRGTRLAINGDGWRMRKGRQVVRILSPVAGTVVQTGGPLHGWYLRVRPEASPAQLGHLLHGPEVRAWLLYELERLQRLLAPEASGAALADGGVPERDLVRAYPEANWDTVWGALFLEA